MTMRVELARLDATAQAVLVRTREVTPLELVDAAIARIEELDPRINAIVARRFDEARDEARGPLPDGPFRGVPFLIKDLIALVAGMLTRGGSRVPGHVADHDSELVSRYRRAGLILLGKTATPEFGLPPTTEPKAFGPTHNPWDLARTPGGSSGGAAAAVASGMVPAAHGNDGAGSIRVPASCCGLFGLKPTRARNPLGPDFGDILGGLVHEHVLTRSVRDSAALLDATAGPDLGDPYWAPPPARPYREEVGAPPGKLRIALSTASPLGSPVHPDCVAAAHDAATLLRTLGHEVVEDAPQLDATALVDAFLPVWATGAGAQVMWSSHLMGRKPAPGELEPLTAFLAALGEKTSAPAYVFAIGRLQQFARQLLRFQEPYDVVLTPTLAEPPPLLGALDVSEADPFGGFMRIAAFTPFTPSANFTGQPAMSVPLDWNAAGLPIGVHFLGRFGDEATLFRLAAQLEDARPWADRTPPAFARP